MTRFIPVRSTMCPINTMARINPPKAVTTSAVQLALKRVDFLLFSMMVAYGV